MKAPALLGSGSFSICQESRDSRKDSRYNPIKPFVVSNPSAPLRIDLSKMNHRRVFLYLTAFAGPILIATGIA
jgi:hypothetical protein